MPVAMTCNSQRMQTEWQRLRRTRYEYGMRSTCVPSNETSRSNRTLLLSKPVTCAWSTVPEPGGQSMNVPGTYGMNALCVSTSTATAKRGKANKCWK